jgi:hypothetical protein
MAWCGEQAQLQAHQASEAILQLGIPSAVSMCT